MPEKTFDVVGVGLNATDTVLTVDRFPPVGGKVWFSGEALSPGGQMATAMVACARLGLRTKYIGAVGDDERARVQMESLLGSGIDISGVQRRTGCANQSAYIVIDRSTGERTVFWNRPECLRLHADDIVPEQIECARLLHIDGHDTSAVERAARIARAAGIPVTVDVDTVYKGFDRVLPHVDYLIGSSEFPRAWTGIDDPFEALAAIQLRNGMKMAGMTLGAHGALALSNGRYFYSPGFAVQCADTTGAGDVFHGAFCYSVLQNMPLSAALEFSNAMAALNCMAAGARGNIAGTREVQALIASGNRCSRPEIAARAQAD